MPFILESLSRVLQVAVDETIRIKCFEIRLPSPTLGPYVLEVLNIITDHGTEFKIDGGRHIGFHETAILKRVEHIRTDGITHMRRQAIRPCSSSSTSAQGQRARARVRACVLARVRVRVATTSPPPVRSVAILAQVTDPSAEILYHNVVRGDDIANLGGHGVQPG